MCFALHLPAFNCEKILRNWISGLWWAEQPDAGSPSNFLLFFRFVVVCFWLEKAYKKWKAIKAVQMGIKRTKRWGGKNARNPQWAAKGLLTKLQDNCSVSSNIKSWRRWWWQTLWRTVSAWKMYLNKFPNIIVQISKCIWRTALVHRGTWLAYRRNSRAQKLCQRQKFFFLK